MGAVHLLGPYAKSLSLCELTTTWVTAERKDT